MKSIKVKEFLNKLSRNNMRNSCICQELIIEAVELAEAEMREKAINILKQMCMKEDGTCWRFQLDGDPCDGGCDSVKKFTKLIDKTE
jgi:hypothetical protein